MRAIYSKMRASHLGSDVYFSLICVCMMDCDYAQSGEYGECNPMTWPRGPMDKASDFESEDCGFESHRGRVSFLFIFDLL